MAGRNKSDDAGVSRRGPKTTPVLGNLQPGNERRERGAGSYCVQKESRASRPCVHAFVFPRDEPAQRLGRPKYVRRPLAPGSASFAEHSRLLPRKRIPKEPGHKSSFSSPAKVSRFPLLQRDAKRIFSAFDLARADTRFKVRLLYQGDTGLRVDRGCLRTTLEMCVDRNLVEVIGLVHA